MLLNPAIETAVWQQRISPPPARTYAAMAYDSVRQRTTLFGGNFQGTNLGDTWEWDGLSWTLKATTGPSPRYASAMAFDPSRGKTVLFGGASGARETWEWDGVSWSQVCNANPCNLTLPPPRQSQGMVWSPLSGKILMFGGTSSPTYYQDTWEYDGVAWTPRSPATLPPQRSCAEALTWDAAHNVAVLFGGSNGANLGDTWIWNNTNWAPACTAAPCNLTMPSARTIHSLAYDPVLGKVLLSGGFNARLPE